LIDDGTIPAGVDQPGIYFGARSGEMLTAEGSDWLEHYDTLRAQATPARRDERALRQLLVDPHFSLQRRVVHHEQERG
jgi:hypothetical protein